MLIYILGSAAISVLLFLFFMSTTHNSLMKTFPELNTVAQAKSPYSIGRAKNRKNEFGYSIQKNGEPVCLMGDSGSFIVYGEYKDAMLEMNRLERADNVRVTRP